MVEQLGLQMRELFTGLTIKQEEDNRRLREENLAIKKQMLELEKEKMQQNCRMEQLMTALLGQMREGQPIPMQAASNAEPPGDTSEEEGGASSRCTGNTRGEQQDCSYGTKHTAEAGQARGCGRCMGSSGTQGSRWLEWILQSWRGGAG